MYMHTLFLSHQKVRFHDLVYELGLQLLRGEMHVSRLT